MLNRVDKERSLEEVCRARESLKDTVSHSRVLAGAIESSSNRVDLMLKFSKRKIASLVGR